MMQDQVRSNVVEILTQAIPSLESKDSFALAALSDRAIELAAVFHDEDALGIALVTYAFGKLVSRGGEEKPLAPMILLLQTAVNALSSDDNSAYKKSIQRLTRHIQMVDNKINLYFQEILEKARIKKGSKLFESGFSIAAVASLLGISQWELARYVGNTTVQETQPLHTLSVGKRLKIARGLFT